MYSNSLRVPSKKLKYNKILLPYPLNKKKEEKMELIFTYQELATLPYSCHPSRTKDRSYSEPLSWFPLKVP